MIISSQTVSSALDLVDSLPTKKNLQEATKYVNQFIAQNLDSAIAEKEHELNGLKKQRESLRQRLNEAKKKVHVSTKSPVTLDSMKIYSIFPKVTEEGQGADDFGCN